MVVRIALFVVAMIVCLFAPSAQAEDAPARTPDVVIIASHRILPAGSLCRIEMQPEPTSGSSTTITLYEGTIKETTKEKIILRETMIECRCINNSPLGRIPFLKRYFKNTGIARSPAEETELQVPVGKIRAITLMEKAK